MADPASSAIDLSINANVGKGQWVFFLNLATLATGDVLTNFTPGFKGRILDIDFQVHAAVTTGSKAATLNMEIGTTNLTGGSVALTSANCTPAGVQVAGTAITGANSFTATDTISIEAASVTAFAEGSGWLMVTYINDDTREAVAEAKGGLRTGT